MRMLRRILLVAALIDVVTWSASAEENSKEGRAELSIAQRHLRSRDDTQRIDAVRGLCAMHDVQAAKLVVPAMLVDAAPAVRSAAYNALLTWKDDPQVSPFLLDILKQESRLKKKGRSCVIPLVMALLAAESPDTQRDLSKFLDAYATAPNSLAILIDAADELGKLADDPSLVALRQMMELKCFSSVFGFRRAVVQAMILVRRPKAMEALIDLVPKIDGEIRGDIYRHLADVAGEINGADDGAWASWWKQHKDDPQSPLRDPKAVSAATVPGTPSYYGLSIQAQRIVFVIDISGSMHGARLEAAQRELSATIDKLSEATSFNIVSFSDRVSVWRKTLVSATSKTKLTAQKFVHQMHAGGHTAAYDALEAALRFDAEAIYFLSDGAPNAGKITRASAILTAVTQTNRVRRISIYTIGIAPGYPGGPLDEFMRTLAEEDFAVYRRVDR